MVDTYTTALRPGTPDYDNLLQKYVSRALIEATREGLPFLPEGAVNWESYQKGHTDTYVMGGIGDLSEVLTATPDEISSPAIEQLESYVQEFNTTEFHRAIGFSSTAERMLPFSLGSTIAERVARAAQVVFDVVARGVWEAGATGLPVIGATTAVLTRNALVDLTTVMRGVSIPPLSDGTYGLIVPPAAVGDLLKESGDASVSQLLREVDQSVARTGVVGIISGVRLIVSNRLTKCALDAYKGIAFGSDAIVFADRGSIQTALVMPSPSIADPTGRRGVASYVVRAGGKLIAHRKVHNDPTPFFHAAILNIKATGPVVATQAGAFSVGTQSADGEGYDAQSKEDLQSELSSRGLPTSGNKAELIERLTANDDEG